MPFANSNDGTRIYWESHGRGDPLVLISGLGYTLDVWHRLLPALSKRHRTIVIDNRGVGRSDVPSGPYGIASMARDVAAGMDAADVGRAHVLGFSMGGMIAQELALSFRERVAALTAPTLVLHGESDILIPAPKAHIRGAAIPCAEVNVICASPA